MKRALGFVVVGLAGASPASACGVCVAAVLDRIIPPIYLWSALSLSWFFALTILSSIARQRLRGQPRLFWALGLGLAAILLGTELGPLTILPLGLFPIFATAWTLGTKAGALVPVRARRAVMILGGAHVAVGSLGVILLAHTLGTRTDAAYACQWPGTAGSHNQMRLFREAEPASIDAYRDIVRHCPGSDVGMDAVERLGSIGDPETDCTLLREAQIRIRSAGRTDQAITAALGSPRLQCAR